MKKALGRILISLFLAATSAVVFVSIILRQLNYDPDFVIYIRVSATIVMGFLLFIWLFLFISTPLSKNRFSIGIDYPVEIPTPLPKVSIIVPAHNEEDDIQRCIESLQRVNYPNIEIFIVDDRSIDSTASIVEQISQNNNRIKLLRVKELPKDWKGKSHAIHQAVTIANGDWFLFVDADTVIYEQTLEIALSYCIKNDVKMISILMEPKLRGFWEKVTMPVIAGSLEVWNPRRRVNDPDSDSVMASGGFILIDAKTYWAIGGHEAIKDHAVEDIELAKQVKAKGFAYNYLNGRGIGKSYWYKTGGEMWRAWSTYIYEGLNYSLSSAVISMLLTFLISVLPFIVFIHQLIVFLLNGTYQPVMLWLSMIQVIVIMVFRAYSIMQYNSLRYVFLESYFFLHFLGGITFIAITISSIFRPRS